jgi:enoyl-CoA hydratase/carnithine racemase
MIAMPEISIGLHPDVGASLFLPKLAGGFGRFMGLTGARISGVDAVAVGLADFAIDSSQIRKLLVDVLRLPWSGQAQKDRDLLSGFLNYVSKSSKVVSGVAPKTVWIEKTKEIFSDLRDLRQFDQGLRSLSGLADANDQKWWSETFARYEAGSWWAKAVFLAATVRHQDLTISQTLEREWEMSMSACVGTEFPEGVRSVLIDKDHRPRWSYATLSEFEAANPNLEEYFRYSKSVNLTNGFAEKCAKHNI